jgi:uncharacterized protein CbrC (UPF0167 family)
VRFAKHRLEGLSETGNRGAAPKYTAQTDKRILAQLDTSPPDGYGRWSGPLIAAALGDVDVKHRISQRTAENDGWAASNPLDRCNDFCLFTTPSTTISTWSAI